MIDQSKKRALIQYIKQCKTFSEQELLLPPDLYFDGYDEPDCTICANNSSSVSTSRFAEHLRDVQHRPDVSGVFVRFYDYDDAEQFAESWIGSDSIYIVTTAGLEDVREWFSGFEVTDVWEEDDYSKFIGLPTILDDSRLIAVWWD